MEELKHYGVPGMKWGVRRARTKVEKLNKGVKRLSDTIDTSDKLYNQALAKTHSLKEKQDRRIKYGSEKEKLRVSKEEKNLVKDYNSAMKMVRKLDKRSIKLANDLDKESAKLDKFISKYDKLKIVTHYDKHGNPYYEIKD